MATDDDDIHEGPGAVTVTIVPTGSYSISPTAGIASVTVADDDPAPPPPPTALPPEAVPPLPLSEHPDPFVRQLCWRIPGCPLSIIFLAPLIAVGSVIKAGGRHPALLGGTFFGVLCGGFVLLDPNPFTIVIMLAVAGSSFVLWRLLRV